MDVLERIYGYFDRNPDLRVLFIFDEMRILATDLQNVEWKEGFVYEIFDGRVFRVKYNIEHEWKNSKVVLLIPKSSPHSESDYQNFPLLDVLAANMEYKGDSAEFFLQEKNVPLRLRSYIESNLQCLQQKQVDKILVNYYNADLNEDILNRGIISAYLDSASLLDWTVIFVKLILLGRSSEDSKRESFFKRLSRSREAVVSLETKIACIFGYKFEPLKPRDYDDALRYMGCSLKYNSICKLLPLSRADNYGVYKVKSVNALDQINSVWDAAMESPLFKTAMEETLNEVAVSIQEENLVKWYGEEGDFFRMTESLCNLVLSEFLQEKLYADPTAIGSKIRDMQQKNLDANGVLKFVAALCDYYSATKDVKTLRLNSPAEYVKEYTNNFYRLDSFYRLSLEFFVKARNSAIEETLRKAKLQLDEDYAKFCNRLNLEWTECLCESNGLENIGAVLQQNIYETFKKSDVKQTIIISDALRYEVGVELEKAITVKMRHAAKLEYALAMLPTETKYCKPALFPHRELRLDETEPNMLVDGTICNSTDSRTAQLGKFVPSAICVQYNDIKKRGKEENRELFKRPLVYIMHNVIDDDGHDCDADKLTEACRKSIDELSQLISDLQNSWNVSHISIVSDHGFLFNDIEFLDKDKHVVTEDTLERKSRYYLTRSSDAKEGIVKFPLSKVSGMRVDDVYVAVPRGTNRLAAPGGGYQFAHGGLALQEIVIPVIHSTNRREKQKQKVNICILTYRQSEQKLVMTSSLLRFRILAKEAVGADFMERKIVMGIYYKDKLISEEKELIMNSTSTNSDERIVCQELTLTEQTTSSLLELRVYDADDRLNPLAISPVTNNTLIEQDF